ncbi:MAG: GFA family protein [Pseudomonadota bacterium]
MRISGGCRCGDISYQIDGVPKFQVQCQCVECQKLTGAGHASIMIFPEDAFTLEGSLKTFSYDAENDHTVTHHFCGECGAPLFNRNSYYDRVIYVLVGSMDDPSVFEPERIVFASSGQKWDRMDPELPGFAAMPTRKPV